MVLAFSFFFIDLHSFTPLFPYSNMNLIRTMLTASMIATSTAIITPAMAQDFIGKQQPVLQSDRMTLKHFGLWVASVASKYLLTASKPYTL